MRTDTKWEYLLVHIHGDLGDVSIALADAGRDGWELVSVTTGPADSPHPEFRRTVAYFKRPVAPGAEPAPAMVKEAGKIGFNP